MKKNKLFNVFLAVTLVAALCVGAQVAAFAEGPPEPATGTEENPAQATIAKTLQMAAGTMTPGATFNFTFTPVSVNDETSSEALASMPEITGISVTFSASDLGTTTGDTKTVTAETNNIFANVTWPSAGVYVYAVTETKDSYTALAGETMTYSDGEYEMTVYVSNGVIDRDVVYVSAVSAVVKTADHIGQTVDAKVDPTPSSSAFVFTNTFVKNNSSDEPADGMLFVSKTVDGDYGSHEKYFDYQVLLTKASVLTDVQVYKVYVLNEDGQIVTTSLNAEDSYIKDDGSGAYYIEVTSGAEITIRLKHNQYLSVLDAPVGTSYLITEAGASNYTPTLTLTVNGTAQTSIKEEIGSGISTGAQRISEGTDRADFVNTYIEVTPTGIVLSNLPYLIMIVLAAGALALFVVVKRRKQALSSND